MSEYKVEPSPNARAGCRVCKGKIEKDAIRVGQTFEHPEFGIQTKYFHITCWKPPVRTPIAFSQVHGASSLDAASQQMLRDVLAGKKPSSSTTPSSSSSSSSSPSKKSNIVTIESSDEEASSSSDDDDEDDGDYKPSSSSSSKKKKQKKQKKTNVKKTVKRGRASGVDIEIETDVDAAAASARAKKHKKEYHFGHPDEDPVVMKYHKLTIDGLKDFLKANGQLLKGTKPELVDKCVDGEKHGRLPRCPQCGKGKLTHDLVKDTYTCSGYFDEDLNMRISCNFHADSVKREEWVEPGSEGDLRKVDAAAAGGVGSAAAAKDPQFAVSASGVAKFDGLDPRAAASELIKLAKAKNLQVPDDENAARVRAGTTLLSTKAEDGGWDVEAALRELAKEWPTVKAAAAAAAAGPQAKVPANNELAAAFDELAKLQMKAGGAMAAFKAKAAKGAALAVRGLDFEVTEGSKFFNKKANKTQGIGKGSAEFIDDFLATHGNPQKLVELRQHAAGL